MLIPLDGSALAESVLPVSRTIAEALQAQIQLLHVIEKKAPAQVHHQRHLVDAATAEQYLRQIAETIFPKGMPVEYHVHANAIDDVARSIVEHADEMNVDIISLCTHGRTHLGNRIFGSIAQTVLAMDTKPVLLVKPDRSVALPFSCSRILIPVDSRQEHPTSLAWGKDLATACKASVHLVSVVPTPQSLKTQDRAVGELLPLMTSRMLDMEEETATAMLQGQCEMFRRQSIEVAMDVFRGDPAEEIIQASIQSHVDLMVVGTHGRSAFDAFWEESVAAKLCAQCNTPMFLTPV